MRKKDFYRCMALILLSAGILSGCGNDKAESKANYRQMGIEYMEQGNYAGAVEAFEAALSQSVGSVGADELDITYYKAAAQYAGGNIDGAMATYSAVIDFDKTAYEAYYLRGCLYCKQNNIEAAKTDFANAIKYQTGEYALYINIYENLAAIGENEEANSYLDKALAIKGDSVEAKEYRGQIYYRLGDYQKAVEELNKALEAGSSYANLYLAKTYEEMGDAEQAESCLRTYISKIPKDALALNELGEIMMKKERYAEAMLYLEQAMNCEVVENRGVVMHNLIVTYEFAGEFDRAWELIQQYVILFPEDADAQREYIFLKNRQMKEESTRENTEENTEENTQESTEAGTENTKGSTPSGIPVLSMENPSKRV